MITTTATPARNTYKGHGKPETFIYFGRWADAPDATGRPARAAVEDRQVVIRDAQTGEILNECVRPSARIWIAPAA